MSIYPYPLRETDDCDMVDLINHINTVLEERGQRLYWFRSSRSTNRGNVTVNAGIFKIGGGSSVYSKECIEHLIHWEWCPRVGKTAKSAQYKALSYAWRTCNALH